MKRSNNNVPIIMDTQRTKMTLMANADKESPGQLGRAICDRLKNQRPDGIAHTDDTEKQKYLD